MNPLFEGVSGARLRVAILVAVVLLAVFLGVKAFGELLSLRYIGAGISPANVISVSGYGEAFGVPDIATFTFNVVSEKSTVATAQEDATQKSNAIAEYLKDAGIEEKDIQTTDYSVYPQYNYTEVQCIRYPCPGQQVLRGYEVRQTTTVKVRNTTQAGELLSGVGSRGAMEVSGLSFTFDDPDQVEAEARNEAIADAKAKAEVLADSLGVSLVRVVSFSENGVGSPMPYAARNTVLGLGGEADAVTVPEISVGENQVISHVSITYEIK
jgi:hypothetical protein